MIPPDNANPDRRAAILIGRILTAIGLVFLGAACWTGNARYNILKSWPTIEAEVTRSETGSRESDDVYWATIEFRFVAEGKQITASSSENSDTESGAQMTARSYAPGTRHTIRYNPANPNDIRFDTGEPLAFFEMPIILGVLGSVLIWLGLKWLRSPAPTGAPEK